MKQTEPLITGVSDTARWVAFHRALESARKDALFRDPYAGRLAGKKGEQIARAMRWGRSPWSTAVRTAVLDELLLQSIRRGGAAVVLNLGAGLDARPYRLQLPADLLWLEADLPEILAYKEQLLAHDTPACRLERAAVDLAEPVARARLLRRVEREASPVLVVSEGLLAYLNPDLVLSLSRDLAATPTVQWWLLDLAGPTFLQFVRRNWNPRLQLASSAFQFGPEEGPDFFRSQGWEPVEVRSSWDEARRLHREPWWMGVLWTLNSPNRRRPWREVLRFVLLQRRP